MRTPTIILTLSLLMPILAGCKSTRPDDAYQAHYTTTPPPGAVVVPATPPGAFTESAPPPVALPPASRLPK